MVQRSGRRAERRAIDRSTGDHPVSVGCVSARVIVHKLDNRLFQVHADFFKQARPRAFYASTSNYIQMWLGEGDDRASIAGNVDTPASINWEGGNDHLNGGGGQSILIGGLGSDRIVGGPADNTLIGGTTLFDRQGDALLSLLQEWSFDLSYPERVANLREGTGPELSGTGFYLRPRDTVSDDDALDLLTGASGLDWFFIDVENDIATDIQLLELTTRAKPEESSST